MSTATTMPESVVKGSEGLNDELIQRLLVLPDADRAIVAERMLESLGIRDEAEPLSDEWKAEIARRLDNYLAGRSVTYSAEEVDAHIREHLDQRRRK